MYEEFHEFLDGLYFIGYTAQLEQSDPQAYFFELSIFSQSYPLMYGPEL